MNVYHGIINCHINYCVSVWGGTYFDHIKLLNILQKDIVRIIFHRPRFSSAAGLYSVCNILPVRNLFVFRVLRVFFLRSGCRPLTNVALGRLRVPKHRTAVVARSSEVVLVNILNNSCGESAKGYFRRLRSWLVGVDCEKLCTSKYKL